jgi:hypothetical protein
MVYEFLKSAAAPAIVVAIGFFLLGGLKDPLRARLQALLFAMGFAGGAYFVLGHFNFPPTEIGDSLAWSALLLMAFVWISPRPVGSRYLIRALFVAAIGTLVLWPIRASLQGPVHTRNLIAFFCLALGTWSILERVSQKMKTMTIITLPLISAVMLMLLLMIKGGQSLAQMVSLVAALLGGLWAVSALAPGRISAAAILPFVSVFLIAFMVAGHFFLHINPWYMVALCIPFAVLWARGWIPFVPTNPFGEALMLAVLALIPLLYFFWGIYQTPIRLP